MRIRSLRFKNLASLAGEWELDFTHPSFVSNGLFAITGPTGSGKSTVLDAICLALYGATPRLGVVGAKANEIISRGCRDCFAEVQFETPQGLYSSMWSYTATARCTEGKIDVALRNLHTGADEIPPEANKKTAKALMLTKVEALTGLDFARFTRSVLLAQGDFAAFMKASQKERATLLERITGTELYAVISTLTYERYEAEAKLHAELMAEVRGVSLLADDVRQSLTTQQAAASAENTALGANLTSLRAAIHWQEKFEALSTEQTSLPLAQQTLEQQQTAFAPQAEQLRLAKAALELDAAYTALTTRRTSLMATCETLNRLHALTTGVEQQAANAAQAESTAKLALAQAQKAELEAAPLLTQVRALDVQLQERNQAVTENQRTVTTLTTALTESRLEHSREQARLTATKTEQTNLQATLQATAEQAPLAGLLSGFRADVESIATLCAQQNQRHTAHTEAEKKQVAAAIAASTATTALDTCRKTLLPSENALKTQQEEQTRLLDGRTLAHWREQEQTLRQHGLNLAEVKIQLAALHKAQTEQQGHETALAALLPVLTELDTKQRLDEALIPQLEARRELLERVRTLEEHRARLEADQPCPLCGSEHHPYAAHTPPPPDETQKELRTAQARLKQSREESTRQKTKQATLLARLEQTRTDEAAARARLHELLPCVEAALGLPECPPAVLPAHLEQVETALHEARTHYAAAKTVLDRLNSLETDIQTLRAAVEAGQGAVRTAERTLHNAATAAAEIGREVARLHSEHETQSQLHTQAVLVLRNAVSTLMPDAITFFQRYAAGESAALTALLEHLSTQINTRNNAETRLATLGTLVAGLEAGLAQREKHIQTETTRLETETAQLAKRRAELDTLAAVRRTLFGEGNPDTESQRLTTEVATARTGLETAVAAREAATRSAAEHRATLAGAEQTFLQHQRAAATEQGAFVDRLAPTSFTDEAAFLAARLPEAQRLALEAANAALTAEGVRLNERETALRIGLQRLESERNANPAMRACLEAALEPLAGAGEADAIGKIADHDAENTPPPLAVLQARRADLETRRQVLDREIGRLAAQLETDTAHRTSRRELLKKANAQGGETARWLCLKNLIGSKEGATYRNFAQSLTFAALMEQANCQLRGMTDRYTLLPSPNNALCLSVVDHYQAGEVRPSSNLSGGETFLVSLALSLALSDMVSRRTGVDSLFLDEGFGTLDPDALDLALSTLASLRREGKLICVISHVPALQERMGLHVEVHTGSGGWSRLDGPGVRAVPQVETVSEPLNSKPPRKKKSKAATTPTDEIAAALLSTNNVSANEVSA